VALPSGPDKRQYQRIVPLRPIPARVGTARVYILDMSVTGLRIAHQMTLGGGELFELKFEWEGRQVVLFCKVVHNRLAKRAKDDSEKSTYHAGVAIADALGESDVALREIIAAHVARALDEQKANARGIPALAAQSFQTGKTSTYLRCEIVEGAWRMSETSRPDQPTNGFTVSIEEDREQIQMLRQAFEIGDEEARKMIRVMAQLSISKAEGVPTRRFVP
jgi:hypothetical protein